MNDNPFRLTWQARAVTEIVQQLHGMTSPAGVAAFVAVAHCRRIHLATMREPYASYVESGSKRVESRWGKVKCAPHGAIDAGDVVAWKRTGGPVYGVSVVERVAAYGFPSDEAAAAALAVWHADVRLPNDPALVAGKRFLTLIHAGPFVALAPFKVGKRCQAGWNILQASGAPVQSVEGGV